ncbi:acyl-CoA thioesterase [Aquimarina hainanensis]|uniref:Acyl-CoA thioesterase n=1 Tax=Aquimarina hainanensis TaxID=1578017 RepID=A0ABW5NEW3_9FLAO|nr:thioesterase family protein [Aquimarina sp. TRL1]QKX07496.1 acyl-CoA thioesterase [Aquimarina sp. TRL1]
MSLITETLLKVRYAETDQMGVVHHSNYIKYIEVARVDWLSATGTSYRAMEESGIMMPVISLDIKYKKSAYFDDQLVIKTKLRKIPTVKIIFDYEIYNENQELLTIASTTLAFMDSETRKPIACPPYLLEKMKCS